jgi:hypothetical protein
MYEKMFENGRIYLNMPEIRPILRTSTGIIGHILPCQPHQEMSDNVQQLFTGYKYS